MPPRRDLFARAQYRSCDSLCLPRWVNTHRGHPRSGPRGGTEVPICKNALKFLRPTAESKWTRGAGVDTYMRARARTRAHANTRALTPRHVPTHTAACSAREQKKRGPPSPTTWVSEKNENGYGIAMQNLDLH